MTRKIDRRTLYTRTAIKDAFLSLIKKTVFKKMTVTSLCREAEITRATFYLHYEDLEDVLTSVLADALELSTTTTSPHQIFTALSTTGEIDDTLMPACQRIATTPKYHALFLDDDLTSYILKTLYEYNKPIMVPYLIQECNISKELAEKIFMFNLYGSFFTNKALHWEKNEEWYTTQKAVVHFIEGGMKELKNSSKTIKPPIK